MRDLKVSVGDKVSRGQLLYRVSPVSDPLLSLPCDAIITSVKKSNGESVKKNDILLEYVCPEDIRITFDITDEDLDTIKLGQQVKLFYADHPEDMHCNGKVLSVTKKIDANSSNNKDQTDNTKNPENKNNSVSKETVGTETGKSETENSKSSKKDNIWTVEVLPDNPRLIIGMSVEIEVPEDI